MKKRVFAEYTIVYFPVPMETASLRGLALAHLPWPRKGVGLTTVLELAVAAINVEAMTYQALRCCYAKKGLQEMCRKERLSVTSYVGKENRMDVWFGTQE